MLLAIDIGNTMTNFGVFEGDNLIATYKFETSSVTSKDDAKVKGAGFMMLHKEVGKIDGVIISSVVPSKTSLYVDMASDWGVKALTVGPGLKTGLKLKVDYPSEVGADLIADSVGALTKYGPGCLIVDLGTANKYILLDKDGAFAGLSIAPGVRISINALVDGAAALPEISLKAPKHVIGTNTLDCMNSGIIYGTQFEIEGFAAAFEKEAGYPLKKVITGGNSRYVIEHLNDFTYDENLTLFGLASIYAKRK
ncbi:MAG: type III pantothenate kinase [Bacilli bacterium]|nr:type III pantothenate kinase [Bacilli bacterium]